MAVFERLLVCVLALAVGVSLAIAAPAVAATVRATTGGIGPYGIPQGGVFYTAVPGEANRVTFRLVPDSRGIVEVRETGARIDAGPRCTAVEPGFARCDAAAEFVDVTVDAGDGDDAITIEDPLYGLVVAGTGDDTVVGACQVSGDDGADHLVGCANPLGSLGHRYSGGLGDDLIEGGPAADSIDGGGGRDVMRGGDGGDDIDDGDGPMDEAAPDVVDGGPGVDTAVYTSRLSAVHVDLARPVPPQGTAREGDSMQAIENVISGSGDDVLLGDDEANRLDAGRGRDTIDGGGGGDQLLGGSGSDTVGGGDGDDYIVARDVYRDTVDCGSGGDQLLSDRGDSVAPGCEALTNEYRLVSFERLGAANRRVSFRVRCLETDELPRLNAREFEPCALEVALRFRVAGRLTTVATGTCNLQGCSPLVLGRAAWRTLLARRNVPASVEFTRIPRAATLRHVDQVTLKVHRKR
jgi:hypothetical protein